MKTRNRGKDSILPADWIALGVLLLAVAARIGGAWNARCITDPDSSVVALMARHMAAFQNLPVFFYGQAYMGSLEPMASALMVRLLGPIGFAVTMGPVLFAAAALFFLWRWARDAAGPWGGVAALLAACFGPTVYFQFQMAARGGYMVALLVDALAIFAAARMAAGLWEGRPVSRWRFGALGLLAGVGLWSNMIVVSALLTATLLLVCGMRGKIWRHSGSLAAGAVGVIVGLLPWLAYNAHHGWVSLEMSELGARAPLRASLLNSWSRFLLLQNADVPFFRPPLTLLALAVLALALAGTWQSLVRWRKASVQENFSRLGAFLFCVIFVGVYVVSGFNAARTARYWVPLVPGLAVLGAAAFAPPGWTARRWAAWGLLLALTLTQGVLCMSAMRILGRRVDSCEAAYRDIGEALERAGADALMAPIQLYPLNFALKERFAVSNGRQEFYRPILRRAELADGPAYTSDFYGIETFLGQRGAKWDSVSVGGRGILWNVRLPEVKLRAIPPAQMTGLRDETGIERKAALTDRNLDTFWSHGSADVATLMWDFAAPQSIYSIHLTFAHGHSDSAFNSARRIRMEVRVDGEWHTVLADEPIVPLEWSGTRAYYPSGLARLEYRVDVENAEALRIGLLETPVREGRLGWRLAEVAAFSREEGPPQAMDTAAVDALGERLRGQKPEAVIYAPRWVSNQLLKRGWVPENRLAGLSGLVFAPDKGLPRDGSVSTGKPGLFVVEQPCAATTRETMEELDVPYRESSEGPWVLFVMDPEGWPSKGIGLPPPVRWTGDALLTTNPTP